MKPRRATPYLMLLGALALCQLLFTGCSGGQTNSTMTVCPDGGDAGCTTVTVPVSGGGGW